ncbi:hypothetical protein U3A58_17370 [Algoriphagus sp. C2-6-M1]|uniref:hypothetical protein n=1 Tax=Algoriphagus persicinus TaxID=3108754 RepID=UPI002B3B367F|nr:hypothetical protein [Algoriphagus sp. C2-6-M1]MEB2782166.1 hypothetical protein [Algoriphagus sp. C2-6-M1]
MSERLLKPDLLPLSLWQSANDLLFISPALSELYCEAIDDLGLRELSGQRNSEDGPVGGLTKEKTEEHFAQAYDGSVARVQLAVLDPKDQVGKCSNSFMTQLAGGKLLITDAPSGCGAATFSFLSALAELRKCGIIPREPLDVTLIGAEISEPARELAQTILTRLKPSLALQAINVKAQFYEWDVTNEVSNTNLIKQMIKAFDQNPKRLLIVANFSGFLKLKRKEAEKQILELLRYSSEENSFGIWIEPQKNDAIQQGGLFSWLNGKIETALKKFIKKKDLEKGVTHLKTSSSFELPLEAPNSAVVRLAVNALKLNIND